MKGMIANVCEQLQSIISRYHLEGPRPPEILHACSGREVFQRWLPCARTWELPLAAIRSIIAVTV